MRRQMLAIRRPILCPRPLPVFIPIQSWNFTHHDNELQILDINTCVVYFTNLFGALAA